MWSKIVLVLFAITAVVQRVRCVATYSSRCGSNAFSCVRQSGSPSSRHENCLSKVYFCNDNNDCGDGSDEKYCTAFKTRYNGGCPNDWWKCQDGRCIPGHWRCDSEIHCLDTSDELDCVYDAEKRNISILTVNGPAQKHETFPGTDAAKKKLITWFLGKRKTGTTTNRWGHQLHRMAVALYLGDKGFFSPGNRTGEEIGYELSIQLLDRIAGEKELKSNQLAAYIQALLVSCINPRDFHGHDLVSELRAQVERSNYTNPFELLALCNAKDKMTDRDVDRVSLAFDSQHRPFWTDSQAMATQALACLSSRSDVSVDERTLMDMAQELKKRQFRNGTVDNLRATALVVQALIATSNYQRDFDLEGALKVIVESQASDGSYVSFLDSYYVLPVLSNTSLLNISTSHCRIPAESEEEAMSDFQRLRGEKFFVQYSVWIGKEKEVQRTWTLKIPVNTSLYELLEVVHELDRNQKVEYNVVEGKPYVSAVNGLQDDTEMGLYWFTFVRSQYSKEEPKIVEESPVDVKIQPNQELILWYKDGQWRNN